MIPIHLDAACERPERRTGFVHPDILGWVAEERPRLLVAALTVLRAYIVAGYPAGAGLPTLGSFRAWGDLICGALAWLGQPDPTAGQAAVTAEVDEDRLALGHVLVAWREAFGDGAHTLSEALTLGGGLLHDALAALDRRWDGVHPPHPQRIGMALGRHARRVVDGRRLVRAGVDRTGVALWRVEGVGP